MSLINDALKKAQRQRTNNPFGINAPMPGGGGRVARRSSGMPVQTIVLIVAGCAVLVVISAIGAVSFVNGKNTPKSKPAAVTADPAPVVPATSTTEFPVLAIQPVSLPAKTEIPVVSPVSAPPPSTTAEKKIEPSLAASTAAATAKTAASPPSVTPAKAAPPVPAAVRALPDERVHVYLDALRIAGVRASGATSRVLLNEKVYRLNETVDRSLNLKLTAVETDFLKFTDSNGVEYEKTF
jgi:hypothetical protein